MTEKIKKKEVSIFNPKKYSLEKSKSLDDYLDQIRVDPVKEREIKKKVLGEIIKDEVLGNFPVGKIVKGFLEWNQETGKGIKEIKKEILLTEYFSKTEKIGNSVKQLRDFIVNPWGRVIFDKILRILDDVPPDSNLLHYLSNTLIRVIQSKDFESLFEKHKYVLSRIEMLSPQALAILYDYEEWPDFNLRRGTIMDGTGNILIDWVRPFTGAYVKRRTIADPDKINRVALSVRELKNTEFIDAKIIKAGSDGEHITRVTPTAGGNEIIGYIEDVV